MASAPPALRRGPILLFVAILAPVSCLLAFSYQGWPGTLAAAGGIVFGGLVAAVGHFFLHRQARGESFELVRDTMIGSFLGIVLFGAGTIALILLWKDGAVPLILTALVLYLGVKFYEAYALSSALSKASENRRRESARDESEPQA